MFVVFFAISPLVSLIFFLFSCSFFVFSPPKTCAVSDFMLSSQVNNSEVEPPTLKIRLITLVPLGAKPSWEETTPREKHTRHEIMTPPYMLAYFMRTYTLLCSGKNTEGLTDSQKCFTHRSYLGVDSCGHIAVMKLIFGSPNPRAQTFHEVYT